MRLVPYIAESFLLQEVEPLSQDLSLVAQIGLDALGALHGGTGVDKGQREKLLTILDHAVQPRAELLLVIVPSIRKLVEATQVTGSQ